MEAATNSSKLAQTTRDRMCRQRLDAKLVSFAVSFPYLVETGGLAHAVAVAKAQGHFEYLEELATVLAAMGHLDDPSAASLQRATLQCSLTDYVHLRHLTIQAALYLSECVTEADQQACTAQASPAEHQAEPRMA
jgi:hypothetical protein